MLHNRTVLIGNSLRMQQTSTLIAKVGRGRWPVLVLGETGTGKEVVARCIHNANPQGPFVTIDCSSMVGPLMESELFGHVKGSFTGASSAKTGLLELANGGTAFLDEIGELPLDLQAKLLRALQEKEFRPVGSNQMYHSDFRVIAATNRDLAKEAERGTFRSDLYYRLNVVKVRIAPLRERTDDIPLLAQHFIGRYGNGHKLTAEAERAMQDYAWPGNVRELENAVQQMVALTSGPLLHIHDLPSSIRNRPVKVDARGVAASALGSHAASAETMPREGLSTQPEPVPQILPLIDVEKHAILNALRYTGGDRAGAANLLGIGRTTLYRKLKEYNLE